MNLKKGTRVNERTSRKGVIIIIIIVAANRRRKVQQRRSSTRSNRKHTMAPLAGAIRSMCDLGAQLTASWNQLYAGFCRGGKTGEPGEKPSKQRREPTQTQPTYGVWSENRTSATLVGGKCSHHCAIPAPCRDLVYDLAVGSAIR